MVRATVGFVLLAIASTSGAFVDPPTAVPSIATPDQIVSIHVRSGQCDIFFGEPDDAEVSFTNNVVTVILDGPRATSPGCIFPTFTSIFHIGVYPAGEYTVNAYQRYTDFFGEVQVELVGSTTFIVTGTNVHHSIPASSDASAFILLLAIALTGVLAARHQAMASSWSSPRLP